MTSTDPGPKPHAFNIRDAARANENYRTGAWTGKHLQVTLMSIPVGESIGLEVHNENDQFLRLDGGEGKVVMGPSKDNLDMEHAVSDGWAIQVPAGTWHDVINTGDEPLSIYAIYAPVHHSAGVIHETAEEAEEEEAAGEDEPPEWAVQP